MVPDPVSINTNKSGLKNLQPIGANSDLVTLKELQALDINDNITIDLKGDKGWLLLNGADNMASIYLEGDTGRAFVGGNNTLGFLAINGKNNQHGVLLSGDGYLGIGGNGIDGSLDIASSKGEMGINGSELLFKDNGQIRSCDDNHRILFRRSENKLELREYGDIIFSPGATTASETSKVVILSNGNVGIGTSKPQYNLDVSGSINVSGDINLGGADCAEEFDVIGDASVEPGTVMVIDNDGALRPSETPYDKRVAGVISGAGDFHPGITFDKRKDKANRAPIALSGKAYCKVDARYSTIEVGDLLTTSPTCGFAMKAADPLKAFGSVIGKALRPQKTGRGMIPVLISLQ